MQDLTVTISHKDNGTIHIGVTGEVDIATTTGLHDVITAVLSTAPPPARVLVNLAPVDFLDCTGITALLAGRALAATRGVTYHTVNAHGFTHHVLQPLGLDTSLTATEQEQIDAETAASAAAVPQENSYPAFTTTLPALSDIRSGPA